MYFEKFGAIAEFADISGVLDLLLLVMNTQYRNKKFIKLQQKYFLKKN